MSYDEVDALADFARAHGITFPLLSDPDSEIITRFGILNTLIDPDDHPWHGIPFPGVYVIDGDGVVQAKFFEQSLHFRPGSPQLLAAARGDDVELAPRPPDNGEVTFDVGLDGRALYGGVWADLVVRFAVPEGEHLYSAPAPDGMVAASVEIDSAPGLAVGEPAFPEAAPHQLAGTEETFDVLVGDVAIRIPVTHFSRSLTTTDDGRTLQPISGTVRWQSCDDEACGLPQTSTFSVEVPAVTHSVPESEFADPDGMDVRTHFVAMTARRTDRPIADIMQAMAGRD